MSLRHAIRYHRSKTWRLQDSAGRSRTRSSHAERRTSSIQFLWWIDHLWLRRQRAASKLRPRTTISRIGHYALWMCIHSREGAWNDEGAPYYGGLQMSYGWDGLVTDAALLSPEQQMAAAETGYRQSGYSTAWLEGQWPNTSPPCLAYR